MSVGLVDIVYPPSNIFATFHHVALKEKELAIYYGMWHESINVHREK
jgi:cephalosporin-C deacetylase-like acetyl esterase